MAAELERNYECPRCGVRAIVVVLAAPVSMSGDTDPDMRAQDDASDTLGLARCPVCDRRPPGRPIVSLLRAAAYALGITGLSTVVTFNPIFLAGALGLGTLVGLGVEARRWRSAGRIRVVRQLRAPQTLPLPEAVARTKPPDQRR